MYGKNPNFDMALISLSHGNRLKFISFSGLYDNYINWNPEDPGKGWRKT